MKKTGFLIAVCIAFVWLCCAGVGNMYVQRHGRDGWLFFVFSQKMPAVKGNSSAKNLEYDYTYLESSDSVTLLATMKTDLSQRPLSASIMTCDTVYNAPVEMIYATPKGKGFVYRIKTVMPFRIWEKMYDCRKPFVIKYCFSDGDNGFFECAFGYPEGKWKGNRKKMGMILETVKFNTGKK